MPVLDIESLFCKIMVDKLPIIVGAVYRSPRSNDDYFTCLNDYLCEYFHSKNTRLVLAGDFNLPNIDWTNLCIGNGEASMSQALLDLAYSQTLTQIVQGSTRTQGSTEFMLDLVFLSPTMAETKYSCQIIDGISDHDIVLVKCPLERRDIPTGQNLSFPDFLKADDESILDFLDVNFDNFKQFFFLGTSSIDNVWENFKTIVHNAIEKFVPLRVREQSLGNKKYCLPEA